MKRFFTLCIAVLTVFALATMDAQAKRFGGGSSIGKQRQSISPTPAPRAPAAAPAPTPAPTGGASRWLGPLAGLAAGGLLASMFMGGGGLGGLGSLLPMLLLAAVAFMIFRMLKKPAPQPMPMQYAGMGQETVIAPPPSQSLGGAAMPETRAGSIPEGFDVEGFLHHAKVNFVRLQAANDSKNLADIREFTTPEMYAEISLSIKERDDSPQQTDVVSLAADLLDVSTEGDHHLASVRFSGMIREASNAPAENFDEIWHLQKPVSGNQGWAVAGIQQVH